MSSDAGTVFLVRHGRTALNARGALRGRLDVELDDAGRAEAEALARSFAGAALALVVTSPLARARQTAAPIAAAAGVRIEIDDALVDRDYGPWAGHSADDVRAQFGSLDGAPGVEPEDELRGRVLGALERAASCARDAPVVVVAHDAVNRTVLAALAPDLGPPDRIGQRTGCWNRLERGEDGGWSVPLVDQPPGRPATGDVDADLERRVDDWLERCRALAAQPLDGIETPAQELADLAAGDRLLMERARRALLEHAGGGTDRVARQMLSLWRRAFERGDWDWD